MSKKISGNHVFSNVDKIKRRYISYSEAAELTGVSVRVLKRNTADGLLPRYAFGKGAKGYVATEDVLKLFERVA